MKIFSRKKENIRKDDKVESSNLKSTKENLHSPRHFFADEFARQKLRELQSEANESNNSLPTHSPTDVKNNKQPNIIDMMLREQHMNGQFLIGLACFVLLSAVINVIVSLVTSIIFLAVISILFTPMKEKIVQDIKTIQDVLNQPEGKKFNVIKLRIEICKINTGSIIKTKVSYNEFDALFDQKLKRR